jgi:hypothetical protein
MGFRICYVAAKIKPEDLAAGLERKVLREVEEMPFDSDWWVAEIKPKEWSVLWAEDGTFGRNAISQIAALSMTTDVIFCEVNETTMWSSAECWSKGNRTWVVTHAGDGEDRFDLSKSGDLPPALSEIETQLVADQNADDGTVDHIFDIPLELAASYIAFDTIRFWNRRLRIVS